MVLRRGESPSLSWPRRLAISRFDSGTIQVLPITCPGRNCSDPNASHRNTRSIAERNQSGRHHREHQPATRERRIDGEVDRLGKQEQPSSEQAPAKPAPAAAVSRRRRVRGNRIDDAGALLRQIAQHQCQTDHQGAGRRRVIRAARDKAWPRRSADRPALPISQFAAEMVEAKPIRKITPSASSSLPAPRQIVTDSSDFPTLARRQGTARAIAAAVPPT